MQITNILESFVSKYKNPFDQRRNTVEDTSRQEFEISINGPNFAQLDTVVEEAMDAYWRRKSNERFLQNFGGGEAEDLHWGLWGAAQDAYCQEQPPIHELACLVNSIDYWQ